jgi:transposase
MLTLSGSLKVFVALEPCDMRKSFDSLHALVVERLAGNPRSGAVFVFGNRARTLIKLLHWDGTGLWVHAKRLEKGTFSWPKPSDGAHGGKLKLAPEALALLTDGIDLRGAAMRPWYERE